MALNGQTLELVIDELVLDGVEPGDPAVGQTVAQSLAPTLADQGLAASIAVVTGAVTSAVAAHLHGGAR